MTAQIDAKYRLLVVANGFYYFGEIIDAPDGFVALRNFAMFGNFSGGKGIAGVCRGDKGASCTLDRFSEGAVGTFPLDSVCGIIETVNLYDQKTTTLR